VKLSTIVDKADKKDCELNTQQTILILNRMQYLRFMYLFTLEKSGENDAFNFRSCCKKAIEKMNGNGASLLNKHQVLMRWNRTFRINEKFPHPNTNIQNGYIYIPSFFKVFPEIKEMIQN